ncbi:MAG: TetR/AcrR family transcriptional regulator [Candidatus Heimdallarchaeota archaeon]|nr:TetR/AcrR family transcriptional regulator [Candidatus Heimdallarchaeota archaeon]
MPKLIDDEYVYAKVMQVIGEKGYRGATTKDLAKAAGISEVSLFRKYHSKKDLVKLATSYILDEAQLLGAINYTGDLEADLSQIARVYFHGLEKYGDFITSLIMEMGRDEDLNEIALIPGQAFKLFGEILGRYQKEGKLVAENPIYAVSTLLGPLMYISLLGKYLPIFGPTTFDPVLHAKKYLEGRASK